MSPGRPGNVSVDMKTHGARLKIEPRHDSKAGIACLKAG